MGGLYAKQRVSSQKMCKATPVLYGTVNIYSFNDDQRKLFKNLRLNGLFEL